MSEIELRPFCSRSLPLVVMRLWKYFNQRSYDGHDDWELRASGVRFHGGDNSDLMTIQEAVDLASLLRRKDYVAQNDA